MKRSRRRRRFTRILTFIMLAAAGTGIFAAVKKMQSGGARPAPPLVVSEQNPSAGIAEPPPAPRADPQTVDNRPPVDLKTLQRRGKQYAMGNPLTQPAPRPVAPAIILPPIQLGADPLADAKACIESDPVMARRILSEAILSNRLKESEMLAARELVNQASQQIIFSRRVYKGDPYTSAYTVQPGETLNKIAPANQVNWELLARINGIEKPTALRMYQTLKLVKGPFHAVITKHSFTMDIYLGSAGGGGSLLVMSLPVGLGKDDSTPTGTWMAGHRVRKPVYYSPRGEGELPYGHPRNPLGDYWIGLTGVDGNAAGKQSYGIHGTTDPNSIGKQESMGCIRLKNDDVALVYQLLVDGKSTVIVKD